jgi:AcrR family transcriptional regulator
MGVSKPRRGRPPLPLEGQRRRLLDAARQLLERRELETAGVRDVVAEAGMSSRAFYQVFESRDALILELAREMAEHFLERLEAVPDPSETLDTEQVSDRLLDAYVEVAAPLVALDGARLPRSTADRLQQMRAGLLEGSLDVMFEKFERAVRAGRLTALPDRTAFEIVLRGVESLTADLSRRGRLPELETLRASIRKLLMAQAPLATRPNRR